MAKQEPSALRNIRLLVAYDGTNYRGWQRQHNQPTVQELLETSIETICGQRCHVNGSGRTDSGAHALGQVANFRTAATMSASAWERALNSILPTDVRILRVRQAHDGFHARFDARSKIYRYQIYTGRILSPFDSRYWHHVPQSLDFKAMQWAARQFLGRHDFSAVAAASTSARDRTRRVKFSRWRQRGHRWVYRIAADGFLHHMVRNIVGTLLEVGLGQRRARDIPGLLQGLDRRQAGPTAPARGLFLVRVLY